MWRQRPRKDEFACSKFTLAAFVRDLWVGCLEQTGRVVNCEGMRLGLRVRAAEGAKSTLKAKGKSEIQQRAGRIADPSYEVISSQTID